MIEQTKFTYSLQGKAFEKQVKTIKEQGEKQKKAVEKEGEKQLFAIYDVKDDFDLYDDGMEKDSLISFRKRKMYDELYDKRFKKENLNDKKDYDNLNYKYKSGNKNNFGSITYLLKVFNKIKYSNLTLEKATIASEAIYRATKNKSKYTSRKASKITNSLCTSKSR